MLKRIGCFGGPTGSLGCIRRRRGCEERQGKRQKAKGKWQKCDGTECYFHLHALAPLRQPTLRRHNGPKHFCHLPFAFCLLICLSPWTTSTNSNNPSQKC